LVTAADRESEAIIVSGLRATYPTHRVVGEESGQHGNGDDFVWYVDPLDGSTNFVHHVPHYAVSIALVAHGSLTGAVVHDPMRNETFHASLGRGSFLNGRPIRVSTVGRLETALIATGFSYHRRQAAFQRLPAFARMLRQFQGTRHAGAAALDLA
jgi:myo-inositol-1(or 4)-monophosphatase